MGATDPDEVITHIQASADRFANGDADDPKPLVDEIMGDIERVLGDLGPGAAPYLDEVDRCTRQLLSTAEGSGSTPRGNGGEPSSQRRLRFLRSIAQLIEARRSLDR